MLVTNTGQLMPRYYFVVRNIFFVLLNMQLWSTTFLWAQYENVWVFETQRGVDFNTGRPVAIPTAIEGFGEANASVCNEKGMLLFYTEGSLVWDRNGNLMPNGSNLTGFTYNNITATSSSAQGTVIVPLPDSPNLYYIFSMTESELNSNSGRLYYSVVDMRLNNGLGDIFPGQKGILLDSNCTESVTAVPGDHCNIWLLAIARRSYPFSLKAFNIDNQGINPVPILSAIPGLSESTITLSPDRRKIFLNAGVFSFNPASGLVGELLFKPEATGTGCFAPDNSKLYVNGGEQIYQYDLSLGDPILINGSQTKIGRIGSNSYMKLGPDQRIYFNAPYNTQQFSKLGSIDRPNLQGIACQYRAEALTFNDKLFARALPNIVPVISKDTLYNAQLITAPCFATSLTIRPGDSSGWNFLWNDSQPGSFNIADSPGTYWVSYYTAPCTYRTDSFTVGFPNGVLPHIKMDTSCAGIANGRAYVYTYPGDTVGYRYTWRDSANIILSLGDTVAQLAAGRYSLMISTGACDTILYFDMPEIEDRVSFEVDTVVCAGDTLTFNNSSGTYFDVFIWSFGDEASSSDRQPVHSYTSPGIYTVNLVGNGRICADTARLKVTVDAPYPAYFYIQPDSICMGQPVTFYAHNNPTVINQFWNFGDQSGLTATEDTNIVHAYTAAGMLLVTRRLEFRTCPESVYSDTVYVASLPVVNLGDTSL